MANEKLFTPGRIGPLTMALLLANKQAAMRESYRYPEDRVMIG